MPKSGVRLPKQTDLPAILLILAISIAGMAMLRQSTPFGLGLNTDSVYYVNGARNMLAGNGFYRNSGEEILKPITHFPPLFSAILSGEEKLTGLDPLRGGRLVIILLYGLNAILFAWLVYELTGSRWPAVIAAGLMVFSPVDLRVYAWLMSEPAYLCLNLLALLAAWRYFKSRRLIYAVILGVLAGLMYLTRYVGISLMAAGLSCFLVFERSWPRRWAGTGLFLVFSLPAVIGVALRNYRLTGSIGNRTLVFHPAPFVKIAHGIQSFWGWFLPSGSDKLYQSVEWFFIGLSFILLVGVLGLIVWRLLDKFRGRSQTPLQEFLLW
ncbi:MAG: glycosyltransferase family 39 protein, partial [Anaerolineaceae bacterium]